MERKINLVYNKNHIGYLSTGEYFKRAARRLGIKVDKKYKDIVLNIESGSPSPFVKGIATGTYEIDVYQDKGNPTDESIANSDVYFSTHEPIRGYDENIRYELLPHGFDPILCNPRARKKYDVALSGFRDGHPYNLRNKVYSMVDDEFNCISVPYKTPTPEYLRQLSKAKIILNVTGWQEMNRRVFDGMAMGVTVVDKCPNTKLLGEEGKHFVTFNRNNIDIIKVIRDLLEDDERYQRIREEGRKYAFENHTYDVRLEKAYNVLREVYDAKIHQGTSQGDKTLGNKPA